MATRLGPQPGPQTAFLTPPADVAIYGGAAGSGKSFALLLEPLRHVHTPGYKCSIFRRTCEQITKPGAIWDESLEVYGQLAEPHISKLRWKFPTSGVTVTFLHCEHVNDLRNFQGTQFAGLCFDELTHLKKSNFST